MTETFESHTFVSEGKPHLAVCLRLVLDPVSCSVLDVISLGDEQW